MRGANTKFVLNEQTILYYRLRPIQACKDLLLQKLAWYQRIMLRAAWWLPYNLWILGRGCSKTRMVATFAVLQAMLYPGTKIGVLGPGKRQGDLIFFEIKELHAQSPYFQASLSKKIIMMQERSLASFTNGSKIESTPVGTDGSKVRGARYNILCLDEYASFSPEIINLVIMPFLAVKQKGRKNKIIQSSSAYYKHNHLYDRFKFFKKKILIEKDEDYFVAEYNYHDVLLEPDCPFEMDMNIVDQQKEIMTEAEFKMEWEACFPNESDSFFTAKLIDDTCTPRPPKENPIDIELTCYEQKGSHRVNNGFEYVLGVDIAKAPGQANFSLGVGKLNGRVTELVSMTTLNGGTYKEMTRLIREATINYNVIRIQMDRGGGGEALKEELAKPWFDAVDDALYDPILDMDDEDTEEAKGLHYLRMVNFQGSKHSNLFTNLKAEMEHGRIKFPIDIRKDPDKAIEKVGFEITLTKKELMVTTSKPRGANLHFEVPSNFRMDRAVALTLIADAVIEIRDPEWKQKSEEVVELTTGFWI